MIAALLLGICVIVGEGEPRCVQIAAENLRRDIASVGLSEAEGRIVVRTKALTGDEGASMEFDIDGRKVTVEALSPGVVLDAIALRTKHSALRTKHFALSTLLLRFLPDYRLAPGMKLRVKVSIDGCESKIVEVPGSDQVADEVTAERVAMVLDGCSVAEVEIAEAPALNYRPDGEALVSVNGTNRFTRALYGTCDLSRVETSDIPEASLYLGGMAETIEFPALKDFERIESRFEKGVRSYELRDAAKIGDGAIKVAIVAAADGDGGVIRLKVEGGGEDVEVEYLRGPAQAKKFPRDGDLGRDPWQGFLVDRKRGVKGVVTLPKSGEAIYLGLGEKYRNAGEKEFAAGVDYAKLVAERIVIKTPDNYLNFLGSALALAENGGWDDAKGVYMHGAIGWRMPLPGWRAGYMADLIGDHERARRQFDNYAASQIVGVKAVKPPTQDPKKAHARSIEQIGYPMFTDGYICRNPHDTKHINHYDMNLIYIDELFWHLKSTGDKEYAKKVWPVIKRHLAWEKRVFDPDNDHLYDAYCCIWASDALQYNGGEVTHSSAYNAFHNRLAAEVAEWIGEDGAEYRAEAEAIEREMKANLWVGAQGTVPAHWAEFKDNLGRQMVHPVAAAWSEYTPIDCGLGTEEMRLSAAKYLETQLPHKGGIVSTTCWQPYMWSINNVAMAEIMHMALANWLAGNDEEAFRIYKAIILDSCFEGAGPGNFEQTSKHDPSTGECYRDFTDTTACVLRATVQGLFGVRPDLIHGKVYVSPRFPKDWTFAELHTKDIDLVYKEGKYDISLHYPVPAELVLR